MPARRLIFAGSLVVPVLVFAAVAEAARVQTSYPCNVDIEWFPGEEPSGPCTKEEATPTASYAYKIGSGAAIAGGFSTVLINASLLRSGMSRQASGLLGIGAGVLGIALGVPKAYASETLAGVNAVVGSLSVLLGVYALATPAPTSLKPQATAATVLRAAPWVGAGGAGILVGLRF